MDLVIKLREVRMRAGKTQKQVARESGVGEKTISSFEAGYRIDSIKVRQLAAMLSACGVSLYQFFTERFDREVELGAPIEPPRVEDLTKQELLILSHMSLLTKERRELLLLFFDRGEALIPIPFPFDDTPHPYRQRDRNFMSERAIH